LFLPVDFSFSAPAFLFWILFKNFCTRGPPHTALLQLPGPKPFSLLPGSVPLVSDLVERFCFFFLIVCFFYLFGRTRMPTKITLSPPPIFLFVCFFTVLLADLSNTYLPFFPFTPPPSPPPYLWRQRSTPINTSSPISTPFPNCAPYPTHSYPPPSFLHPPTRTFLSSHYRSFKPYLPTHHSRASPPSYLCPLFLLPLPPCFLPPLFPLFFPSFLLLRLFPLVLPAQKHNFHPPRGGAPQYPFGDFQMGSCLNIS